MPNTTSLTLTTSEFAFHQGERIRTTSFKVSEAFNKQHKDVLKRLESLECSDEFNGRDFALVDCRDKNGQLRKAYEMTKDGFMFLVMGVTGTKAAHIKEAYINAFNQMASQLRSAYQRCQSETHWTYHIKFQIQPTGDKYCAKFELGVGGKGETKPWFSSRGAEFINSGFYLEY